MLIRTRSGKMKEVHYDATKLYNYGINRLQNRDYLKAELYSKMARLCEDTAIIQATLDKLVRAGLLNDKRVIEQTFLRYASKESASKTKQRLLQKGADKQDIEEYLVLITPQDDAPFSLISKKFKRYEASEHQKIVRFLASRGFDYGTISKAISQFKQDADCVE